MISGEHGALTLRTLQTLAEVATEHNSTLVLPIPLDIHDLVRERTRGLRHLDDALPGPVTRHPLPAAPCARESLPRGDKAAVRVRRLPDVPAPRRS